MNKMPPVLVLQARAEARALLFSANEFDLYDALAPLLAYALDRVADDIGSEATYAIIRKAFQGAAEI